MEVVGNFKLWYNLISEEDTRKYSLINLFLTILFLLDGKSYKWGSSEFDLGAITFSYLYEWFTQNNR